VAYARGRGRELPLRRANIRPTAQQLGGVTDGQRFGISCDGGRSELLVERTGPLAQQNRQPVVSLLLRRLERRNGGLDGFQPGTAAIYIELGAAACLIEQPSELERLTFTVQVLPGHLETLLGSAKLEVVARHFGGDRHLRVSIVGHLRTQVGPRGLHRAAHSAEQVDLPGCVEAEAVASNVVTVGTESRLLLIEAGVGAVELHVRRIVELVLDEHGTRRSHAIVCASQVQIGGERAPHERVELLIVELLPPDRLGRPCDECGRWRVLERGRGGRGSAIVGTDGTRGEEQRGRGR
jgi:hypothetical protein